MKCFPMVPLLSVCAVMSLPGCNDKAPPEDVAELVKRTLDNMVYVEGGSFMMGDIGYEVPESDPEGAWVIMEDGSKSYRKPFGCQEDCSYAHKVTLTGYYIYKYEVTYGEYDVYTQVNGLPLVEEESRNKNSPFVKKELPTVLGVDWFEAQAYCQWLGEVTGLAFDLPTEAQWEYAARSRGQAVKFATDNGKMEPGRNYRAKGLGLPPQPPGSHPPNPLGLYDMTGNANEWVQDWYDPFYYEESPEFNPQGPKYDSLYVTRKVSRGFGTVNSNWNANLVIRRIADSPENDGNGNGFRCVIHSDQPLPKFSDIAID